jgi:tetratricopeptide (TPR) repeat protein
LVLDADRFLNFCRRSDVVSGQELIINRLQAIEERVDVGTERILEGQEKIFKEFDRLNQQLSEALLPKPPEVNEKISKKASLITRADVAVTAYNKGYAFFKEYRFAEAISQFESALAITRLPEFYLAIGHAALGIPDLGHAEQAFTDGLALISGMEKADPTREATFANMLGRVLQAKGDLNGALHHTERALKMDEMIHGPSHPTVARDLNDLGVILHAKGDLDGALSYTKRALKMDEASYGSTHPYVATKAYNLGQILKDKGDLDGALRYSELALKIDETTYGPTHTNVARDVNSVGRILQVKGDLHGAPTATGMRTT